MIKDRADRVLDMVLNVLLKEPLLKILLHCQKTLDGHGIETIYRIYQEHAWKDEDLDWSQYTPIMETMDPSKHFMLTIVQILMNFLVSVTLKDCSILIALHPGHENTHVPHVLVQDIPVYYRISLVDLDAKKGSKIPYYFNQQQELIEFSKSIDSSLLKCCQE